MNLLFIIKEGIVSLRRARVSAIITILSISLSLILLGLFGVVGQNVQKVFRQFYQQIRIEAFLDPSLSQKSISRLQKKISGDPAVERVVYISPADALKEFQQSFGSDVSSVLESNPLPPSLRITLKPDYSSPDFVDEFVRKISKVSGIQEVVYQKEVVRFVHKYFSIIVAISLLIVVIVTIIITILIFNTIRLSIHSRRDIIQIMRLVGASNLFVKSPFMVEGFLQGLVGGLIAILALDGMVTLIRHLLFPGLVVPANLDSFLIAIGLLLGWVGSYLSVNKYLK